MARRVGIIMSTVVLLSVVASGNDMDVATAAQSGIPGVWRQLAGQGEGTQVADFDASCPPTQPIRLRHQWDITVAGGSAVGTVTIAMDTCLRGISAWDGSFVLRTRVGDISGSASGFVTEVLPPDLRAIFTLTPTSGTGALGNHFVPLTLEVVFRFAGFSVIGPADGTLSVRLP
jgi:hypothetical protein